MAELILTDAEKKAEFYVDWDDATLGKAVRSLMHTIDSRAIEMQKMLPMAAALLMVGLAINSNAAELTMVIQDTTIKGKSVGDWEMIIRNITDGEYQKQFESNEPEKLVKFETEFVDNRVTKTVEHYSGDVNVVE